MDEKQQLAATIKHLTASLQAEVEKAEKMGLEVKILLPMKYLERASDSIQARVSQIIQY